MDVRKLVTASLFAALCCVMTLAVQIPSPMEGYVHLGDSMVLLAGYLLPPLYGGLAAGIGSALADLFAGYTHYALATFVIKMGMAVLASMVYRSMGKKTGGMVLGGVLAEVLMVVGYFGFAALVLGNGWAAMASVPMNVVQGIFGVGAATALGTVLVKNGIVKAT